jgi:hypothetical protein
MRDFIETGGSTGIGRLATGIRGVIVPSGEKRMWV